MFGWRFLNGVALAVLVACANVALGEVRVDQLSFCMARGEIEPSCEKPIIPNGDVYRVQIDELPTDRRGGRVVWVWSTSTTSGDTKIAYSFTQEATGKSWTETIHVHWIDRATSILNDVVRGVKDGLAISFDPKGFKFTQATGFTARRGSRNRWPAKFTVGEPGTFHLAVIRFGRDPQIVPGGERMTLVVEG